MHFELLYPSKYLKASDLRGKDVTLTIRDLEKGQEVQGEGGRTKRVHIMRFEETAARAAQTNSEEKRLILNITNCRSIAKALGENEIESWVGRRITLFPTECAGKGGEVVACIRVRPTAPPPAKQSAPPPPPPEDGLPIGDEA